MSSFKQQLSRGGDGRDSSSSLLCAFTGCVNSFLFLAVEILLAQIQVQPPSKVLVIRLGYIMGSQQGTLQILLDSITSDRWPG